MGYSGSIYLNGEMLFNEWKSANTFYCMDYPQAYLRSIPCFLSCKAIDDTINNIHHGVAGYGAIAYNLTCATTIINGLSRLLSEWGSDQYWDEDGNCLLVIKMQNYDTNGNSQDINFYRKDAISDVMEVDCFERVTITEEELEDMHKKRILGINTTNIFSAFDNLKNGRDRYQTLVEDIVNMQTRDDLFDILIRLNEGYEEMHRLYSHHYQIAMQLTKILKKIKSKVKIGKKIYVKYIGKTLFIYDGNDVVDIECDEFFLISDLFANNGIDSCSASITITDKSELRAFITSFNYLEHSKRSNFFESLIIDVHNKLEINKKFKLSIAGGF